MRSRGWIALLITILLIVMGTTTLVAQQATETTEPGFTLYVVQPGDTLVNIAARFNVSALTIANDNGIDTPYTIYSGQQLEIRTTAATSQPTPPTPGAASPTPGEAVTYTVQSGDTLFRIATRFGTTVNELTRLNNLTNRDVIYPGQTLIIAGSPETQIPPTADPAQPLTPIENPGFGYGVQVFLGQADLGAVVAQTAELGVSWAKIEINWRVYEQVEGQISFTQLDALIDAFTAENIDLLLTVTGAPDWARSSESEEGPPDDFADYAVFVGALAERYAGRVAAYEIWTEPNLRREWNSSTYPIGASAYADLLRAAYSAIKASDPAALVVSAGLSPTGFNDGINAINDRVFLEQLYDNGLADISDAVGAHPGGWANPPDSTCCAASEGVETHFEDRSFYFLDTLNDYRQIMTRYGDTATPLWVTEFGWGSSADTTAPETGTVNVFVAYTDLTEQAAYAPRGFELGMELGYIGPMFLYNLNGCTARPNVSESCYYSLTAPDGTLRPVFAAVQAVISGASPAETETPSPTIEQPTATATAAPPTAAPIASEEATEQPAVTVEPVG